MKLTLLLSCLLTTLSVSGFASEDCCKKQTPVKTCARAQSPCCTPDTPQECMGKGEPMKCCGPAYNAPAAIDVSHKKWGCCPLDFSSFVDFSFTYWFAGEEGLAIAETGVLNSSTAYFPEKISTLFQESDYKPGFKVGLGTTIDHETVVRLDYTWYRGKNITHSEVASGTIPTAGTSAVLSGTKVWIINDWFLQGTPIGQALAASQVSSSWKIGLDLIDAVAGRPMYLARSLSINPFAGLRSAFIRQSMHVQMTESASLFSTNTPTNPITSHTHSHSWSIGPRAGVDAQYLLPYGLRFEGSLAGSLLYTRYKVKHNEDRASLGFNNASLQVSYSGYSALRPAAEFGLGMGWGMYFYNQDYHIDFSADYDFMIFWAQNMMRKLLDDSLGGTGSASSDLYLHGLTFTSRFDF
jgi:hypothetical protein